MIDFHVHFFPERVFRAIWEFFETRSHGLWRIHYRLHGDQHVETLARNGVERFTTLVYAHRTGMADYLNDFVAESAARYPQMIPFGTIFAGDGDVARRARRLFEDYGFEGIKLHPFVSREPVDDERYFDAYAIMQDLGRILVCHPGSGPAYEETDGARRLERVLSRFPALKVVAAHCGAFEYSEYAALGEAYSNLYFDTAMNCVHTHVFERNCPGRAFFERFADRIVFGSDFPNIPYPYPEQIDAIKRLDLGAEIERKIFAENAEHMLAARKGRGLPVD